MFGENVGKNSLLKTVVPTAFEQQSETNLFHCFFPWNFQKVQK